MGQICAAETQDKDSGANQIFSPFKIGNVVLKNRIVMSALTRCRCDPADGVPTNLHVKYYTERAESAGLVITECAYVAENGHTFPGGAGIITKEQIEGWKKVTSAVHEKKGMIFIQIYHCGRGVQSGKPPAGLMGPSPIAVRSGGADEYPVPKEMTVEDIKNVLKVFKVAAEN